MGAAAPDPPCPWARRGDALNSTISAITGRLRNRPPMLAICDYLGKRVSGILSGTICMV